MYQKQSVVEQSLFQFELLGLGLGLGLTNPNPNPNPNFVGFEIWETPFIALCSCHSFVFEKNNILPM